MPDLSSQIFRPIILPKSPVLPSQPPSLNDFVLTDRLTRERLQVILATIPDDFLWPVEVDLLAYVLSERQNAIAFTDNEQGIFNREYFPDYVILVIEHTPWVRQPIPIPKAIEKDVRDILRSQTVAGKFEQSCAAYRSRVFTVMKKNGNLRLVHDLQDLNAVTIRDAALPPRPDDFAERFVGRTVYGLADLFSGYDARTLHHQSRDLTTFQCMDESKRNTCLPQGAMNAVSDFGRCTKHVLADEPDADVFVDDCGIMGPPSRYDDVAIPGNPGIRRFLFEYASTVDRVLRRFELAGITASRTKLVLASSSVEIVGSVVSHDGWHLSHGITAKVEKWTYPESVTDVRSFLGVAGVGRRWIKGFSLIAKPLTILCRKSDDPFCLTDEAKAAVDELKRMVCSTPVLKAIDYEAARQIQPPVQPTGEHGLIVVAVDSSVHGAGWVLYQFHQKERHPALFGSCTFSPTESRYSQPKLELYGVFRAIKELRTRVWGSHFRLEVDAIFLKEMIKEPDLPNAPMTRWVAYLQLFDFSLQHVPAEKGKAQDALSRRTPSKDDSDESDGEAILDEVFGYSAAHRPPEQRIRVPPLSISRSHFVFSAALADRAATMTLGRDISLIPGQFSVALHQVSHLGTFALLDPEYFARYPPLASMLRSCKTCPVVSGDGLQLEATSEMAEFLLGDEVVELEFTSYVYVATAVAPDADCPPLDYVDVCNLMNKPLEYPPRFAALPLGFETPQAGGNPHDSTSEEWDELANFLASGSVPEHVKNDANAVKKLRRKAAKFFLYNDRLWMERQNVKTPLLVITDATRRRTLIAEAHNAAGHRGRDATFKALSNRYFWPNMYADIAWFVRSCNACQFHSKKRSMVPLEPTLTPCVFHRFVADTIHMPGGFLFHVSCSTSKWAEARFAKHNTSSAWARFLREDLISRFGCVPVLVCDGGAEFKGAVEELLARHGITIILSMPYHPEGNGIAERDGQTLANAILKSCGDRPQNWRKYLHAALLAVRTTTSRATGFTPYYLTYGMHCLFPFDLADRTWYALDWHDVKTTEDLLSLRIKQLARRSEDIDQAVEHLRRSRQRAVDDHMRRNAHRINTEGFQPGTWVLVHETWLDKQHGNKGALRWAGPYIVHSKSDSGSYLLKELDGAPLRSRVAGGRLRLFYFRDDLQTLRTSFVSSYADSLAPSQLFDPMYEYTCNLIHFKGQQYWLDPDATAKGPSISELVDEEGNIELGDWEDRAAHPTDISNNALVYSRRAINVKVRTNVRELLARV